MAEIISLNRARKAKERAVKAAAAAENRVKFGRTKAEKAADRIDADRRDALLDGVKRED